MGKVYTPPTSIPKPDLMEFSKTNFEGFAEAEDAYIKAVSEFAKKNGKGNLAGELVSFPFADGFAQYVVYSTSPVILLHLKVSDGWQYPYAHRLTATDIKEKVRQTQSWTKAVARADKTKAKGAKA